MWPGLGSSSGKGSVAACLPESWGLPCRQPSGPFHQAGLPEGPRTPDPSWAEGAYTPGKTGPLCAEATSRLDGLTGNAWPPCLPVSGGGRPAHPGHTEGSGQGPCVCPEHAGSPQGSCATKQRRRTGAAGLWGWGSDLPHCLMAGPMCAERGPRKPSLWASRPRAQPVHGRRERDHLEAQLLGFLSARWQEGLCSSTAGDMQM